MILIDFFQNLSIIKILNLSIMDKVFLLGAIVVVLVIYVIFEAIRSRKSIYTTYYGPVTLISRLKGKDFDDGDWLCEFNIDGKMTSAIVYINDANAKPGDVYQGYYDGLSISIPCILLQEETEDMKN